MREAKCCGIVLVGQQYAYMEHLGTPPPWNKNVLVAGAFWVENVHQMSFASTQMKCYSAPAENEKSGVWAKQGQKMKEVLLKFDIPFSIESYLDLRSHKDPQKVYPRKSDIESQNHPFGNKENHFNVFSWLLLLICSSFGKGLLVIQVANVSSSPSAQLAFGMMPMFLLRENTFSPMSPMSSPPHWPPR